MLYVLENESSESLMLYLLENESSESLMIRFILFSFFARATTFLNVLAAAWKCSQEKEPMWR